MKILNLGSLNFDKTYQVEHFVKEQETILAENYQESFGGKGLNQSVALARAGAKVFHVGAVGQDGAPLIRLLSETGVNVERIYRLEDVSGHAVIQLSEGQNCIIVYGGANQQITPAMIEKSMDGFGKGDMLLLQNETSCVEYAMRLAKEKGMQVAFNASPITKKIFDYPLELVDLFLINEVEGMALAETEDKDYQRILDELKKKYPAAVVLTVGNQGAYYQDQKETLYHPSFQVDAVDTTAAGDTFCGYFLAELSKGSSQKQALHVANAASALAVSKKGAAESIPTLQQVKNFLNK